MASPIPSQRRSSQADEAWFLSAAAQQIRATAMKRAERLNGRLAEVAFLGQN